MKRKKLHVEFELVPLCPFPKTTDTPRASTSIASRFLWDRIATPTTPAFEFSFSFPSAGLRILDKSPVCLVILSIAGKKMYICLPKV